MKSSMFTQLRRQYHKKLCKDILGPRMGKKGVYSNADDSSLVSVELAKGLAERLGTPFCDNPPSAQRAGALFSRYTEEFLDEAFGLLQHLRPGSWRFSVSQARMGIASFYQYEHLSILRNVLNEHVDLKASLGGDYLITPDIVVSRAPCPMKKSIHVRGGGLQLSRWMIRLPFIRLLGRRIILLTINFYMQASRANGACEAIEPRIHVLKHSI